MSAIREEIIKLTKFKGDDAMYEDDTQEYLAALLLAVDKMSAKEYDKLSDDAYNWHVDAVKAKDNDQDIPDFPDSSPELPEDDTDEGTEADDEADQEAGEPADDADPDEDEDEAGDEPVDEPAGEDPEADDAAGTEEDGPVPVEAEPSAPPANPVKPRAKTEAKKEAKAKKPGKKPKNFKNTRDYTTLTGEVDKFGVTIGTKTHEAVKMYEKGCTAAQLEDTIGGRHYNILAKLIKDGHRVEKLEGGVWKLTHKDSVKKGKK